jgi:hypothetical protein
MERIINFIENEVKGSNSIKEQEGLQVELPPSIRFELMTFGNSVLVKKISFF